MLVVASLARVAQAPVGRSAFDGILPSAKFLRDAPLLLTIVWRSALPGHRVALISGLKTAGANK